MYVCDVCVCMHSVPFVGSLYWQAPSFGVPLVSVMSLFKKKSVRDISTHS